MVGWVRSFERRCGGLGVFGFVVAAFLVPRWMAEGVLAMDPPIDVVSAPRVGKPAATPPPFHATTVDAGKVREAFESSLRMHVTGAKAEPAAQAEGDVAVCPDLRVAAIAFCDDPSWSFAALVPSVDDGSASPRSVLRREGGLVGDRRIAHVGRDRVWLRGDDGLCEARLSTPPAAQPLTPPGPRRAAAPSVAGISQGMRGGEIEIDRSLLERFESDPAQLRSLGALSMDRDPSGRALGLRISGLKPSGLPGALGLRDGDRLGTVNGFELTDPNAMLTAYAHLYAADSLHLEIVRDGKPMSLDYRIK